MSFFSLLAARFSLTLFCAFFFTFFDAPLSFACATPAALLPVAGRSVSLRAPGVRARP